MSICDAIYKSRCPSAVKSRRGRRNSDSNKPEGAQRVAVGSQINNNSKPATTIAVVVVVVEEGAQRVADEEATTITTTMLVAMSVFGANNLVTTRMLVRIRKR